MDAIFTLATHNKRGGTISLSSLKSAKWPSLASRENNNIAVLSLATVNAYGYHGNMLLHDAARRSSPFRQQQAMMGALSSPLLINTMMCLCKLQRNLQSVHK